MQNIFRVRSNPILEKKWKKIHGEISAPNYFPAVDCVECGRWISIGVLPFSKDDLAAKGIPSCRAASPTDYMKFAGQLQKHNEILNFSGQTIFPIKLKRRPSDQFVLSCPSPGVLLVNTRILKSNGLESYLSNKLIQIEVDYSVIITNYIPGDIITHCTICGRKEMVNEDPGRVSESLKIQKFCNGDYLIPSDFYEISKLMFPPGFERKTGN